MKEVYSKTGIRILQLNSWDEFISEVRNTKFSSIRIFRGQRDINWKLSSKWERWLNQLKVNHPERNVHELFSDGAYEKVRDIFLKRFKENSIGLPGFSSLDLSENDWWALGRHHDLITPLLDWTKSPYIAAFFSFIGLLEKLNPRIALDINSGPILFDDEKIPQIPSDINPGPILFDNDYVCVWELNILDNFLVEGEFELLSSLSDLAHNQKAQQGIFTSLNHEIFVDIESYLNSRNLVDYLLRYDIPIQYMINAIADLHSMNINYSSMFLDHYGAAKQANISMVLSIFN